MNKLKYIIGAVILLLLIIGLEGSLAYAVYYLCNWSDTHHHPYISSFIFNCWWLFFGLPTILLWKIACCCIKD